MKQQERAKKSKSGIQRKCETCEKVFYTFPYMVRSGWGRFCGLSCKSKWVTTTENYRKGREKIRGRKGHPNTIAANKARAGEKAYQWLGENVGYRALHEWVCKELGQPNGCDLCGNTGLRDRQYHWANISGEYKRDLSDWSRLCVKCHKAYDSDRVTEMAY